jgi:cytochrome P450
MRVRNLISRAFTANAVDRLKEDLVVPIVQRHIDAFATRGHTDLVAEFTFTFPVHVIAAMLGLPEEDLHLFHRRAVEIVIVTEPERSLRASRCLADYLSGIIAQRRAEPHDDIITRLVNARLDGEELTDAEIINFCRLLLPAGAETTYRSLSNLLFGLLHNPEQLAAVAANRSLVRQTIEEGLRWETPTTLVTRTALCDTTVEDIEIESGTTLALSLAATNRDPARHERPDEFDIFREARSHLAFGIGTHVCLGGAPRAYGDDRRPQCTSRPAARTALRPESRTR